MYIDGKLCITGNHYGLVNPSVEVGIIYARVLLEFLGLKANNDKTRLVQITNKRKMDDIGIVDFSTAKGPLQWVLPSEALAIYPGPPSDAESGLLSIIAHADKSVAHLTKGPIQDGKTPDLVILGAKGVLALVSKFLYDALGHPIPDYMIPRK